MNEESKEIIVAEKSVPALTDLEGALRVAEDVAKLITQKGLCIKIQGKNFAMVEGWQFIGSRFGIIPMVGRPKRLEREGEICYECSTELMSLKTGDIVGRGYALCSNLETTKRAFQEYAIASMAQTRSVGKAFRNTFSWLMKASGFEPTPAEEMDEVKVAKEAPPPVGEPIHTTQGSGIDIYKDKIGGKGRFAEKVYIEAPLEYFKALKDPQYWENIGNAKRIAIDETIAYLENKIAKEMEQEASDQLDKEAIEDFPPVEDSIIFDSKGDVRLGEVVKEVLDDKVKEQHVKDTLEAMNVWEVGKEHEGKEPPAEIIEFMEFFFKNTILFSEKEGTAIVNAIKKTNYNLAVAQLKNLIRVYGERWAKKFNT